MVLYRNVGSWSFPSRPTHERWLPYNVPLDLLRKKACLNACS
ncbi:hypothetical protein [Cardinium endosymbiont of Tipula unca]